MIAQPSNLKVHLPLPQIANFCRRWRIAKDRKLLCELDETERTMWNVQILPFNFDLVFMESSNLTACLTRKYPANLPSLVSSVISGLQSA